MGKRSAAEEKVIAHHEAGHFVIAYFLEIPLAKGEVTIVPDDKSAGSFRSGVALSRLDLDWGNSDAVRTVVERCVQMCLGGVVAQQRYLPSSVRPWHGINDLRFAADLIGAISCDREVVQPYIDMLRARTQLMFEDPLKWKCVQAIATALIETRTLSLRNATGIVEATIRRRGVDIWTGRDWTIADLTPKRHE
jgi:hypothetical protein